MKKIANTIVLGAGAIGMLPAAKLLETENVDLRILADASRVARYRRDGVYFNGRRMDMRFLAPGTEKFTADFAIVAVKTYSLPDALKLLPEFTDENTIILPLLNGITAHDVISASMPSARTLYGLFLGHASVRTGNRIEHDGIGTIYFGERDNSVRSVAVERVLELFERAKINVMTPGDMPGAIWRKFILNVGINQTQALFRADYGMVQNSSGLMDFVLSLMREAASLASLAGIEGAAGMVADAVKIIRAMPPKAKTSMLQDVLAGRSTEVDAFAGEICRMGRRFGVKTPCNEKVVRELSKDKKNIP